RNAQTRIDVLARLPEVIAGAGSDQELFVRLISLLLSGIPLADAVALVRVTEAAGPHAPIEGLHWDKRQLEGEEFQPSEGLIREAVTRKESVLHRWGDDPSAPFTAHADTDWAFCTPVLGSACQGWGIYVAGRKQSDPGSSPGVERDALADD